MKNIIHHFAINTIYYFKKYNFAQNPKATLKEITTLRAKRNTGYWEPKNIWGLFSSQVLSQAHLSHMS